MVERSARLALPMLVAGQGQKDVTHNEALAALDCLVSGVVESRVETAPPGERNLGSCWLVPIGGSAEWEDRQGTMACWTAGGWRFLELPEGFELWVRDELKSVRKIAAEWVPTALSIGPGAAVSPAIGGAVVDSEARRVLADLLQQLTGMGLLST